ncbi:hypothetical protein [Cellulomonas alba]|uniref:Uncharacterized protein n=1 Tax=Cellulomonas alba TaxID=3053467 RepID=A0ABT7SB97_9CELL|nr:hypothetical protein [Cellulomonas alba]MDM7853464.1 hypothetical protein [Cellulomonas alba]
MEQVGWAWCNKCQGLFYNGNTQPTVCPAGGAHDASGSGAYSVDMNADAGTHAHGQPDWSWCTKCQGLAYGPGFGSSACPAGGTHDGSGSGNYTLDFVGDDTPATEQQGWSWCHKCQGLFYGLNPAAPCAAGDTHDSAGSGAYAVPMQAAALLSATAAPMVFNEFVVLGTTLQQAPEFGPDQESAITADATTVVTDTTGKRWCTLGTWVGFPASIGSAGWQCRRAQLTITFPATVTDAQVLPFSAGSPTASLDLGDGATLPLTVVVDSGAVRLVSTFAGDDAGAASYDAAIGALSAPAGGRVSLSSSHDLTIHVAAPAPQPVDPGPVIIHGIPPVWRGPVLAGRGLNLELERTAVQPFVGARLASPAIAAPALRIADSPTVSELSRRVVLERPDWRRVFVPQPTEGGDPTHTATVAQQGTGNLAQKPQSDADAFPDIPRQQAGGWLQVSPAGSTTSLHCLAGERAELFYYLPTEYRLGFHATDDSDAPATPFRVTMARGDDDRTTITVTMTAMPYLSDDDRHDLASFLVQHELQGSPPYVELRPATGLKASFQADFLSDGQPVAMSSITYALAGTPTSDLLQIRFTMDQLDYGLLAAMLAKGVTGAVALSDDHITVSVPVRMQLDKVVTNAVTVALPPTPDPPPDPYTASVVLTNTLAYPVSLDAFGLSLVTSGHDTGILFHAEQFDLLEAPLTVAAGTASTPLTYTPSTPSWTSVVTAPGVVTVHGPDPATWIDTVNRDPSLQPSKVSVTLSPSVPAAHLADIRSVTVAVYAAGDTSPRQPPLDIAPGHDAPLELQLTLAQLAAGLDLRAGFFLEFTSRFADDTRSLPQRTALDLTRKVIDLIVLWEPPGASYFVDGDTSIGPVTREVAGQVIATLRSSGKTWGVRAVAPGTATPPTPAPPDPAPSAPAPPAPPTPAPPAKPAPSP